jgi:hypothetical protein
MTKILFSFLLIGFLSGCSYVSNLMSTKSPSLLKGVLPQLPPGYCYLDSKNQNESRILYRLQEQYGKNNGVKLQIFLPCETLEAIRKGIPDQKITQYGMFVELEASESARMSTKGQSRPSYDSERDE